MSKEGFPSFEVIISEKQQKIRQKEIVVILNVKVVTGRTEKN